MFFPPLLIDVAAKATLVLLAAFAAAWALRRAAAAVRHLLWTLTLASLAALPVLTALLPAWHWPVNQPWSEPASRVIADEVLPLPEVPEQHARAAVLVVSGRNEPAAPDMAPTPANMAAPAQLTESSIPWLLLIWLAGLAVSVLWLCGGLFSLRILGQRSARIQSGRAWDVLRELMSAHALPFSIRLLASDHRSMPMTWGFFRPTILLPREAEGWSGERLRFVLLHELGHVCRGDFAGNLLARLVRGLYWFHPLAWLAVHRLNIEQELACDDFVIDRGVAPADYAAQLLATVAGVPEDRLTTMPAAGISSGQRLHQRIERLLDGRFDHRPLRRRAAGLAVLLAVTLIVPLAVSQPAEAVDQSDAGVANVDDPKKDTDPPRQEAADSGQKKLEEVRKKLRESYVAPLDDKQLTEDAIRGMLQALKDPYTDYLPPDEEAKLVPLLKGGATGIGAQLRMDDGRLTVQTPLEGAPALKAGIRPGDVIQAIDGQPTRGLSLNDAVKKILGPAGEAVKLKIVHSDGVAEDVTITRAPVVLPTVQGFCRNDDDHWRYLIDPGRHIAYLRILQFGPNTGADLKRTLAALNKDGMKGLILDLRSCPGGFLNQALQTCKFFIDKGDLLTTQGPNKEKTTWKADGKDFAGDFPLVVLIDERTASAAEIVAGSLRDHQRAILLGTRTFGKGTSQALVKLDSGGMLRVTTAHHLTPKGRAIHKGVNAKTWGIDPTDGYYFPVSDKQADAQRLGTQKREIVGLKKDERVRYPAQMTPRIIEEQHADAALAAALRTMVARITRGEFVKVGKSLADMRGGLQRLEDLRRRQDELLRNLRQVEREIAEAQKPTAK